LAALPLILFPTIPFRAGAAGSPPVAAPPASSLFVEGCPQAGRSLAKKIGDPRLRMNGPDALGGAGDYLLMNERAAFIVEGVERINSYYYYGGILIDAAAIEGCAQANPEQFEELGLFVGRLDPKNPLAASPRAFRGDRLEVRADGSDGGPAVVRVYGADDIFWIAELTLIRMAYQTLHVPKPMSRPLGLELYVDYILPPDSAVLRIEFNLKNLDPVRKSLFTGAGAFFGDATVNRYYSEGAMPLFGFSIDTGMPYLVSSSGQGAWAFGMKNAVLGTSNLSGFDAIFNTSQLQHLVALAPAGKPGDTATLVHYMAVGDHDFNSAIVALAKVNPRPLPGWDLQLVPFTGFVADQLSGAPLAGVTIEISVKNAKGEWKFVDGFQSDALGFFGGSIPDLGREYRLTANLTGRPDPEPILFRPLDVPHLDLAFAPGGKLAYDLRDDQGRGLPARISLYQNDRLIRRLYSRTGVGEEEVVPGRYEISVTRGYEYIPFEGSLEIAPGQTARLAAVLTRAVNTDGFLSADMHLHAGPSGDNKISIPDRMVSAAAEGLEVAVETDHEAIVSWDSGVSATGLGDWIATVTGEEVTASSPEHINAFPFVPRFDLDARGGPVKWQGHDLAEIYALIRRRGAAIIQLNHPRDYLDQIGYDLATGRARLQHPEYLGLKPGAALWSWDFDSIELQNGSDPVFKDPLRRRSTGMFDYWMSFINLGHRIAGVANTDAHDWQPPGIPRTYFPSATDRPAEFKVEELVRALKEGRVLASTGAFARVRVDGKAEMGDTIALAGDAVELWVHIESIPAIDITHFKVFVNCDQALNVAVPPTNAVVKFDGRVRVPIGRDAQIVVMGFGERKLPRGFPPFDPRGVPRFTTNPIYVDRGGDGWTPPGGDGCSYRLP
jgi:hypothetical protein